VSHHRKVRRLPPVDAHRARVGDAVLRAGVLLVAALAIGMVGLHWTEGFAWVDALLGASMILTGMGPAQPMTTTAGKLFLSAYAIFSGFWFLGLAAVLFQPVFHRFMHRFHLEIEEGEDEGEG
jgi:hypothetical protein